MPILLESRTVTLNNHLTPKCLELTETISLNNPFELNRAYFSKERTQYSTKSSPNGGSIPQQILLIPHADLQAWEEYLTDEKKRNILAERFPLQWYWNEPTYTLMKRTWKLGTAIQFHRILVNSESIEEVQNDITRVYVDCEKNHQPVSINDRPFIGNMERLKTNLVRIPIQSGEEQFAVPIEQQCVISGLIQPLVSCQVLWTHHRWCQLYPMTLFPFIPAGIDVCDTGNYPNFCFIEEENRHSRNPDSKPELASRNSSISSQRKDRFVPVDLGNSPNM